MKITFTVVSALLLTLNVNLYAGGNDTCTAIFNRKLIDLDIKSNKGWNRVCYNNKITLYLNYSVSKKTMTTLCNCLYKRYKIEKEIDKGAFDDN